MTPILLTYPIWGTILAFAAVSLFTLHSGAQEFTLGLFFFLNLLCALPIWKSPELGAASKVMLSLVFYVFAYFAVFVVTFFFARCQFLKLCGFG